VSKSRQIPEDIVVVDADLELDARGLRCPLPILRTKKALATLHSGQRLRVLTTDPGSMKDFSAFARQSGNVLEVAHEVGEGEYEFVLVRR
jgi:tRNA 2-thiouridine synthesizing protein A